jgi:beta-lactam-binding protein with PASTA domain
MEKTMEKIMKQHKIWNFSYDEFKSIFKFLAFGLLGFITPFILATIILFIWYFTSINAHNNRHTVYVPDFENMTLNEAIKKAKEEKLEIDHKYKFHNTKNKGYIINQDTEPNTKVFKGRTIKVYISEGKSIK